MHFYYLCGLLLSIAGLLLADWKYKLALFSRPKFFGLLMGVSVMFFLVWDVAGIILNIFHTNPAWVSGIYFATRDLPLEELLFLTLFSYVTILTWRLMERFDAA